MMQMALEKNRVNVKLLAFLKKTLPEREYRCLCFQSCEPCMVETEDDSKVQKHVFCTSNRLYTVDSGLKAEPKALCALEDILQVRKVSVNARKKQCLCKVRSVFARLVQRRVKSALAPTDHTYRKEGEGEGVYGQVQLWPPKGSWLIMGRQG